MGFSPGFLVVCGTDFADSRGRATFGEVAPARDSEGWRCGRRRPSPAASGVVRCAPSESVLNQNLLYLVFKCLMRTKDSGSAQGSQALFRPQKGARKAQEKQPLRAFRVAYARSIQRLSRSYPPADERSYDVAVLPQAGVLRRSVNATPGGPRQEVGIERRCSPPTAFDQLRLPSRDACKRRERSEGRGREPTSAMQVAADLRRRILRGELKPGARLKIDDIAECATSATCPCVSRCSRSRRKACSTSIRIAAPSFATSMRASCAT